MTYRSVFSLLFLLVVGFEFYLFLTLEPPVKTVNVGEFKYINQDPNSSDEDLTELEKWDKFFNEMNAGNVITVDKFEEHVDYRQHKENERKLLITIVATVVVGSVATFAMPNRPIKRKRTD